MSEVIKKLIKYDGMNTSINLEWIDHNYKQMHFDGIQRLFEYQEAIDQIIKIKADVQIDHHDIVSTPIGTSMEGQNVTGNKMFIVGTFKFYIEYLAQVQEKKVYIARFLHPFCEYIVLPQPCRANHYMEPVAYIEDMYVKTLDCRTLFYNASILLVAK